MSNLADHSAEQSGITAACEAGTCGHKDCWGSLTPYERADQIMTETAETDDAYPLSRRAARSLMCFAPDYDDFTIKWGALDMLTDFMHLCDLAGWDFAEMFRESQKNYLVEIRDCGVATDETLRKIIERN